jgi:hypothetical protein
MDEAAALKLQIKSLEDQLAFARKQLEDKDKQVEQLQTLVKAMQDFINKKETKGNLRMKFTLISEEVRPPPGLEQPKQLKSARKPHSFHIDPSAHQLDDDSLFDSEFEGQVLVEDYEEYPIECLLLWLIILISTRLSKKTANGS